MKRKVLVKPPAKPRLKAGQAKQQTTSRPLPAVLFTTCVLDPNWGYDQFGLKKHGAQRAHYRGSTVEELAKIPVWEWIKGDGNLFCWATMPKIADGIDTIRAWDFSVVTGVPWIKTVPHKGTVKQGVGFWGYSTCELLLLCRRGTSKAPKYKSGADKPYMLLCGPRENPCCYDPERHDWLSDPTVTELAAPAFWAKLGPHSRKPLSLYEWIEAYFPGRYLELFARNTRQGWVTLGHEAGSGWHLSPEGPVPLAEAIERGMVEAT